MSKIKHTSSIKVNVEFDINTLKEFIDSAINDLIDQEVTVKTESGVELPWTNDLYDICRDHIWRHIIISPTEGDLDT